MNDVSINDTQIARLLKFSFKLLLSQSSKVNKIKNDSKAVKIIFM